MTQGAQVHAVMVQSYAHLSGTFALNSAGIPRDNHAFNGIALILNQPSDELFLLFK